MHVCILMCPELQKHCGHAWFDAGCCSLRLRCIMNWDQAHASSICTAANIPCSLMAAALFAVNNEGWAVDVTSSKVRCSCICCRSSVANGTVALTAATDPGYRPVRPSIEPIVDIPAHPVQPRAYVLFTDACTIKSSCKGAGGLVNFKACHRNRRHSAETWPGLPGCLRSHGMMNDLISIVNCVGCITLALVRAARKRRQHLDTLHARDGEGPQCGGCFPTTKIERHRHSFSTPLGQF